jgi:hypothetical protein
MTEHVGGDAARLRWLSVVCVCRRAILDSG